MFFSFAHRNDVNVVFRRHGGAIEHLFSLTKVKQMLLQVAPALGFVPCESHEANYAYLNVHSQSVALGACSKRKKATPQ